MAITLDGTSGVTAPLFDGPLDAADLTGDVAAARITGALNATGSAPIYVCRAWVSFNGTGTVAIRASGNVSSITDNNTGDYTVNFTTAMPDANYGVSANASQVVARAADEQTARTAALFRMRIQNSAFALIDDANVSVAIFR